MPVTHGPLPSKVNVSKQILVTQHLSAHYKKLQGVKAAIDTSSPYTFTRNPTTRGYRVRKQNACNTYVPGGHSDDQLDAFCLPTKFSDDPAVDDIVKGFLKNNPSFIRPESSPVWSDAQKEISRRSTINTDTINHGKSRIARSISGLSRSTYTTRPASSSGDVLERYQHKFTQEKPFSPRTIKTNAESKLRRLRCYNPPVRARRLSMDKSGSRPVSAHETQVDPGRPQIRPNSSRSQCSNPLPGLGTTSRADSSTNPTPSERGRSTVIQNQITVRSQSSSTVLDPRTSQTTAKPQPLSISKHQSNTPPTGTGHLTELNNRHIGKVDQWLNTITETGVVKEKTPVQRGSRIATEKHREAEGLVCRKPDTTTNSGIFNQEDLGYLNYIEAVTNDALARGIFTDRNLNCLLMEHAARNEFGLTNDQLQQAADQLRYQLKISDDASPTIPLRFNSDSWSPDDENPMDTHALPSRTSLSGELNDSGLMESSGTTVSAKLVLTSMRPPPIPGRSTSVSITQRLANGRIGGRVSKEKSSEFDDLMVDEHSRNANHERFDDITTVSVNQSDEQKTTSLLNERSTEVTDALAPLIHSDDATTIEHEDTLNDQLTIPNFSGSVRCTDISDIPETSTPVSQGATTELGTKPLPMEPSEANTSIRTDQQSVTRHPRVKFAPEPEVFMAKSNDPTTSATSLTDLTQLSSTEGQVSSQPDAEPDLSSVQAIAEGDSNFSFELVTPPKNNSPFLSMDATPSPRSNM